MDIDMTKEYSNGEITIIWKPAICINAGDCYYSLPEVFQPHERPWIKVFNATSEEIIKTVCKCPSGALTYRVNEK